VPRKDIAVQPKLQTRLQLQKPKLYKVILNNDDYTPREFVTIVLKAVFRMSADTSNRVMMTAHKFGKAVVVVCTKDIAETKSTEANDLAKQADFPLLFTTEPEE
jgi:ATP-dependent Clp protease adaptor protein ClpS